jgi:hypothetical protein
VLRLLLLVSVCAYADSISVEISPDRSVVVREHFSLSGPTEFEFLASPCARVLLATTGTGPWFIVPILSKADIVYQVVPVISSPRTCAVPIVMPKRAIDSVSLTVTDRGSGLTSISVPQLAAHPDLKTWTGTFPAIPSHVELEWETGNPPPASIAGPVGRFNWNFWGLVFVLVTWTIAYLMWARRPAS